MNTICHSATCWHYCSADASAARARGEEGFERLWRVWPVQEGRAKAKEAFEAVMATGVPIETLVTKAEEYATGPV